MSEIEDLNEDNNRFMMEWMGKLTGKYVGEILNQLYKECRKAAVEIEGMKYVNMRTLYYTILANNKYSKIDVEFDIDGNELIK